MDNAIFSHAGLEHGVPPELSAAVLSAFEGPVLEFSQRNFDIRVEPNERKQGMLSLKIGVRNENGDSVGQLTVENLSDDPKVARVLEPLFMRDTKSGTIPEGATLPVAALQELFSEARRCGAAISSDFGRNTLDMLENYQRMIVCHPSNQTSHESIELGKAHWSDITLPIADRTALRDLLAGKVEGLLPGTLAKHAPSEPLFLDLRSFAIDPRDDCRVLGSKICFFLIDGTIVSLHENALDIMSAARKAVSRSNKLATAELTPGAIFCEISRQVLDNNDRIVNHLEDVVDSINRELTRSGKLGHERIEDDIPDLLDSLRYCDRKFEAMCRVFSRLGQSLRNSDPLALEPGTRPGNILNSLDELSHVASTLQAKTRDLMEQARQVLDTYKTNLNTEYEHSQKKSGLVQAITLPVSIGLAAAALMVNRGAQPLTIALISFAVTVGLAGWGLHKNWF